MSLSSSARCSVDVSQIMSDPSDVCVDTLGKFVAIAGENGRVAIADLGSSASIVSSFDAHSGGAIVRVAWAHHRFGRVLATACESGEVSIWVAPEAAADQPSSSSSVVQFSKSFSYRCEQGAPCHGLAWAPNEYGAMLAIASGTGHVVILNGRDKELTQFDRRELMTHGGGCHSVSWSPCAAPGTLLQLPLGLPQQQQGQQHAQQHAAPPPAPRLVTCGPERSVRIWRYLSQDQHWLQEQELSDLPPEVTMVRDVAWSPNPGLPFGYVAAGSEEGYVGVWLQDGCDGKWNGRTLPTQFRAPVCRVGWSSAGSLLHVSCADGSSSVWRETCDGPWVCAYAQGLN